MLLAGDEASQADACSWLGLDPAWHPALPSSSSDSVILSLVPLPPPRSMQGQHVSLCGWDSSWAPLNLVTASNLPYLLAGIASQDHLFHSGLAHCNSHSRALLAQSTCPVEWELSRLREGKSGYLWPRAPRASPGSYIVLERSYAYSGMQEAPGPLAASSKVC